MTTGDPPVTAEDVVAAAGAVVWRPTEHGDIEVLLVHRPKYDDWSLPKGKADPDEHLLACALREVAEETGHSVHLGRPLALQRYVAVGRPKTVQYWAARSDDKADDWRGTTEIDAHRWVPAWRVADALTRTRDTDVVRALMVGPMATTPLVVLRHTDAVSRKAWARDDQQRPVSRGGAQAADELVPLLRAYGISRVVSSDAERCTASVRPYADAIDAKIEEHHGLSERGHKEDPGAAPALLTQLLEDAAPTVVCSHRPVIPVLTATLGAIAWDGVELPLRTLRTGEMLVAHHADGIVASVETHTLR